MPDLPQPNDGTSIATAPSSEAEHRLDDRHRRPRAERPQHA